jgi:dTMP kinase
LRRAEEASYRFAIVDASQSIERIRKLLGDVIETL